MSSEQQVSAGLVIDNRPPTETFKVGLVVPVLNYFAGLADLLISLRSRHTVVTYVMPQYRAQEPLAKAWNNGITRAVSEGCDYIIVANDDVMFAPQCIDNLISEYQRLSGSGVILVSANNIMGAMPDKYAILDYYLPVTDVPSVADHPNFSLFMVARDFFDKVGTFDEKFLPAWFEDNDMHYRIHLAGLRAVTSTACPSVHIGSVTTIAMPVKDSSISERHYMEKWGSCNRNLSEQFSHPYNDDSKSWRVW